MNLKAWVLSDSGHISSPFSSRSSILTVAAPKVSVISQNGSIQLSEIIAVDEIVLSTINGDIHIAQFAVAKEVTCASQEGSLRGHISAYDKVSVKTTRATVDVVVNADKDVLKEFLVSSGLLANLEPRRKKETLEVLQPSESFWRTLEVTAVTQMGSTFVKYTDQDRETLLMSEVKSMTGTVKVSHSEAFQGIVEFEATIGSIAMDGRDKMQRKQKSFEVDLGNSEEKEGKDVQGRVFSLKTGWDAVGPDRGHAFPLSRSRMFSNLGIVGSSTA